MLEDHGIRALTGATDPDFKADTITPPSLLPTGGGAFYTVRKLLGLLTDDEVRQELSKKAGALADLYERFGALDIKRLKIDPNKPKFKDGMIVIPESVAGTVEDEDQLRSDYFEASEAVYNIAARLEKSKQKPLPTDESNIDQYKQTLIALRNRMRAFGYILQSPDVDVSETLTTAVTYGVGIAILAGAGYGGYRIYKHRKEKSAMTIRMTGGRTPILPAAPGESPAVSLKPSAIP